MDLPVLLKFQRRVKELEQEKQSLWQQLDNREEAQQEKAKVCTETLNNGKLIIYNLVVHLHYVYICQQRKWRSRELLAEQSWTWKH